MSIDPSELIQAGSTLYETGQGSTYIPTTSAGGVGFMVMSYPGRPPMGPMQGMPPSMPMPYMQLGGPPPLMQAMQMPMPPHHMIQAPPMPAMSAPPIRYRQHHAPPLRINSFPKRPPVVEPNGPPVTVFVGNITERAPDAMIRHILAACGNVVSWKRVQAFGFCEFGSPDSGLRAIRLLHDMELGGKKLVAKVDAKTKTVLDEYKAERRKKQSGQSPLQDENPDEDDYMDEGMKQADAHTLERILAVLEDYEVDMNNFVETVSKSERNKSSESKDRKMSRTQEKLLRLSQGEGGPNDMILDDVDIEEGKRDLITREIGKFREIMKKQEEEKEVERRRKEREHDASATTRARSPQSTGSPARSKEGSRSPSQDSLYTNKIRTKGHRPRRSYSRERERERDVQRDRERERESHRERERERERDRDRERERERDRDREREDAVKKSEREVHKEKEMEEEAKEKKKADRKAKEKEAAYQERLRNWETRERRKHKDAEKEKEREKAKEEEREREAKRLKEFLEDYDDERDDSKYYKGRELQRRLTERKKEVELDARDRQKEKEELEELKTKIFAEDHHDPDMEFERLRKEVEDQYKPKILISVTHEQSRQRERERERERLTEEIRREEEEEALAKQRQEEMEAAEEELRRRRSLSRDRSEEDRAEREAPLPQTEMIESEEDEDDHRSPSPPPPPPAFDDETSQTSITSSGVDNDKREAGVVINWNSPQQQQQQTGSSGTTLPVAKKKKLDMKEVFNTDDDDDNSLGAGKKRKLVPLDYGPDEKKRLKEEAAASGKSQEEKRKHIKTLIDKIPTDKTALFAFTLDWSAVDNQLMERRIRPWINKKIIEYIGEPEPTLVDFICSKVLAGSAPQGILDDVQMVLDEEAEVFVVKMWRLLIYEIEAKKLGLVK